MNCANCEVPMHVSYAVFSGGVGGAQRIHTCPTCRRTVHSAVISSEMLYEMVDALVQQERRLYKEVRGKLDLMGNSLYVQNPVVETAYRIAWPEEE